MQAQAGGASYFGCRVKTSICLLLAFFSGERSVGPAWERNQSHQLEFPRPPDFLKKGGAGVQLQGRGPLGPCVFCPQPPPLHCSRGPQPQTPKNPEFPD